MKNQRNVSEMWVKTMVDNNFFIFYMIKNKTKKKKRRIF